MLIRNAYLYEWQDPLSAKQFENVLARNRFREIGSLEKECQGWVNPLNEEGGSLMYQTGNLYLFALQKEIKIIPESTVKKRAAQEERAFQKREGRPPTRKERVAIKRDIKEAMLPGAATRLKLIYAIADSAAGYLLVQSTSRKDVEDLLGVFTGGCVDEGIKPKLFSIRTCVSPGRKMREWLGTGSAEDPFALGVDCELADENSSKVKYSNLELDRPDVREHMEEGKEPLRLGLVFAEGMSFVLVHHGGESDIALLKIRYGDNESAPSGGAHDPDMFDSDLEFSMSEILAAFRALLALLGGVQPRLQQSGARTEDSPAEELAEA